MSSAHITQTLMPHVMNTYARLPFALERGEGVRVWDTDGREYLDALAGIAVSTLGHAHPRIVKAIAEQAGKIMHCCNYYQVPLQEEVAKLLVKHSGLTNAFFCNSGLEANEAAIKIARKYGVDKGIETPLIIVFDNAFHGRSLATLAATGNDHIRKGFGPLPQGFKRIALNDLALLEQTIKAHPHTVAVMMEVIQGEGGIHASQAEYLKGVRALCDQHDLLLIADEIQCGLARTGKWFAWQWADGVQPDIVSLAKGLASGVPVGATLCGPKTAQVLQPSNHGTTFGGNPLAMRATLETLHTIEDEHLRENALCVGAYLKNALATALAHLPDVVDIRGQGLMLGIELSKPCGVLLERAATEEKLLLSITAGKVIRLLPALIFSQDNADDLVSRLTRLITKFLQEG